VRALQWKLRRDAWHYRSQIGAIALVMACGVAVFVSLRSMHGYLRERQAAYYADYHFAELFAQVRRAPLALVPRLRAIPGVEAVEPRVVSRVVLDVPGLDEPATGWLVSIPDRPRPMLNGLVLRSGRYPAPGRGDEVLVSEAFARANRLKLTDRLGAVLEGRWETLRIVGTAISPEFIYEIPPGGASFFPDSRRFGVIWMQESGLAAAFDLVGAFNDVNFGWIGFSLPMAAPAPTPGNTRFPTCSSAPRSRRPRSPVSSCRACSWLSPRSCCTWCSRGWWRPSGSRSRC
jgi:putative ABC transport system permease protein